MTRTFGKYQTQIEKEKIMHSTYQQLIIGEAPHEAAQISQHAPKDTMYCVKMTI